jgi:hypothetical protein
MATINLGSIKFKWKGTYNGATAYTVDDVVEYNGSSYICILASTGNLPTDTTYFEQMSQAGTDGTDLTSTLTTQGDLVYYNGSALARLGAGTSGQVLQTNGTGANPSWGTVSSDMVKVADVNGGDTNALAIDSCFSSTYENYLIYANIHTSATAVAYLRLQDASNTELTSAVYFYSQYMTQQYNGGTSNGVAGAWAATNISMQETIDPATDGYGQYIIHMSRPFVSNKYTVMDIKFHAYDGGGFRTVMNGSNFRSTTSCAGFRFFASTGNITSNSNVKVYGLK